MPAPRLNPQRHAAGKSAELSIAARMNNMRLPSICAGTCCLYRARGAAVLLIGASLSCFVLAQNQAVSPVYPAAEEFFYHHDHILGTSLDVWLVAPDELAAAAGERAILDEIERLRRIFSTFDPDSEISRLNATAGPVPASPEMLAVLRAYEVFQQRSHGAFNGQLGELVTVWKAAEKTGTEPDAATLERIVGEINQPGWQVDEEHQTVARLTKQPLNLNSIAKGHIIQKAAAAARNKAPRLQGLLLNLGGDMAAWGQDASGRRKWTVGVQDPFHPEDNAVPLTLLQLENVAVATSGGYERFYTIGGKRYSHLFDPRSGRPAAGVASATVVAPDNVTANALATTLCVLSPEQGLRLVADTPGANCLLVTADGRQLRSPGLKALELALPGQPAQSSGKGEGKANGAWPEGYQVSLTVTLPMIADGKRYRRPYVAVWVENAEGKPVRTIAVWGNNPRYTKDLTQWWKFAKDDQELVKAVTRATRPPGRYQLVWDGKDDAGKALPQGTYTVRVEVHREHGKHVQQTGKIECGAGPATVTLDRNAETEVTVVEYAKKK
jgi:thiamine biosynthesis lipoprotein ApbE